MDFVYLIWSPYPFLFSALIGIISYFLRLVSKGGVIAVFMIGLGDYLGFGFEGFLYMIIILYSASIITIYGNNKNSQKKSVIPARRTRDFYRIVGGGGVGGFMGFLVYFGLLSVHAGSVSLVVAFGITSSDTWASSIGILSKKNPLMIIPPWRRVEGGISGAVSMLGEASSLIGALIGCGLGYIQGLLPNGNTITFVLVLIIVILGEKLDSFLGATIQGSYFCDKCNLYTENSTHSCGERGTLIGGSRLVTNTVVNLLTTIIGATTIVLIFR